jgi:hypothetical protein
MEAFNFVVANEDHNLYIFDMRYVLSGSFFPPFKGFPTGGRFNYMFRTITDSRLL